MPPRTAPRKIPRQERARLTVEAILTAAAEVFERHGYAAGTTNRIAQRAGISIGSLYQYYPNKDAILVALVERHLDDGAAVLAPVLARLADDPPVLQDGLREVVEAMVALHRERPGLHRVLFEEAPRPPALRERLAALEAAATEAVAAYLRARPAELAPGRDPVLAARMATRVVEAVTHDMVLHPEPGVPIETYISETVALLRGYLGTNVG